MIWWLECYCYDYEDQGRMSPWLISQEGDILYYRSKQMITAYWTDGRLDFGEKMYRRICLQSTDGWVSKKAKDTTTIGFTYLGIIHYKLKVDLN